MGNKDRAKYNAYMKEYMLRRYHKRMAEARERFGNKCERCGIVTDLDFHHRDPSTKILSISQMWTMSADRFEQELVKCELICKTCHIDHHKSTHSCGTVQRYWVGCRCNECRQANATYHKEYRRRQKPL